MVFSKNGLGWSNLKCTAINIYESSVPTCKKDALVVKKQGNSLIGGNKWAFKLGPIKVEVAGVYLKDSSRTDPQLLMSCSSNGKNQVSSPPLPALGLLQLPSVCQS